MKTTRSFLLMNSYSKQLIGKIKSTKHSFKEYKRRVTNHIIEVTGCVISSVSHYNITKFYMEMPTQSITLHHYIIFLSCQSHIIMLITYSKQKSRMLHLIMWSMYYYNEAEGGTCHPVFLKFSFVFCLLKFSLLSVLFLRKKCEPFLLENASNLTHEFLCIF